MPLFKFYQFILAARQCQPLCFVSVDPAVAVSRQLQTEKAFHRFRKFCTYVGSDEAFRFNIIAVVHISLPVVIYLGCNFFTVQIINNIMWAILKYRQPVIVESKLCQLVIVAAYISFYAVKPVCHCEKL